MPDTKETFDSISKNYDLINQLISFGLHRKWKSNFINTVNFYGKVIDIATGTGDIAMEIKKKHPDANLTGYDPSPNMLDIAKKKCIKNDVDFVESDEDYQKVVDCLKREITGREFVNLTPSFF